jgi:hypothetical protein
LVLVGSFFSMLPSLRTTTVAPAASGRSQLASSTRNRSGLVQKFFWSATKFRAKSRSRDGTGRLLSDLAATGGVGSDAAVVEVADVGVAEGASAFVFGNGSAAVTLAGWTDGPACTRTRAPGSEVFEIGSVGFS